MALCHTDTDILVRLCLMFSALCSLNQHHCVPHFDFVFFFKSWHWHNHFCRAAHRSSLNCNRRSQHFLSRPNVSEAKGKLCWWGWFCTAFLRAYWSEHAYQRQQFYIIASLNSAQHLESLECITVCVNYLSKYELHEADEETNVHSSLFWPNVEIDVFEDEASSCIESFQSKRFCSKGAETTRLFFETCRNETVDSGQQFMAHWPSATGDNSNQLYFSL